LSSRDAGDKGEEKGGAAESLILHQRRDEARPNRGKGKCSYFFSPKGGGRCRLGSESMEKGRRPAIIISFPVSEKGMERNQRKHPQK